MFFVNSSLPDIQIRGTIFLGYQGRLLGERSRSDDAGSDNGDGSFSMKVHLMKEPGLGNKDDEGAMTDKNIEGLFLIIAGTVLVLIAFFRIFRKIKQRN